MKNITVNTFREHKLTGEKLTMITCYDYTTAKLVDQSGIDSILVGDSLGMTMLGYDDTLSVTLDDMIHHSAAVARGAKHPLIICDMPFMTYSTGTRDAVINAGRLIQEGNAHAVKLEGGTEVQEEIKAIVAAKIPVCAHIGLTPQSVNTFGGFKVQGKDQATVDKLLADAKAVEEAGAFAVVMECVPAPLAKKSPTCSPYPPSASAPASIATAKSSCTKTCSVCSATSYPNSSNNSPISAKPW